MAVIETALKEDKATMKAEVEAQLAVIIEEAEEEAAIKEAEHEAVIEAAEEVFEEEK
jgi:regulator of protease activity HflC (stomatin/prohibitin superfamily)